jgi:hypothetical protein
MLVPCDPDARLVVAWVRPMGRIADVLDCPDDLKEDITNFISHLSFALPVLAEQC